MRTIKTATVMLAVLAAGPVAAAEMRGADLDALRAAKGRVDQNVADFRSGPKGGSANQDLLLQEQRRLDRLIQDLEAGHRIDPAEVDRAVERAGGGR